MANSKVILTTNIVHGVQIQAKGRVKIFTGQNSLDLGMNDCRCDRRKRSL
jgi:hypothetical protein